MKLCLRRSAKMSHFCPFFWPFFIFEYFNNGQIEWLSNVYVYSCSHRHGLDVVSRDGNRSNGVRTEMKLIESCHCARSENTKLNNKVCPQIHATKNKIKFIWHEWRECMRVCVSRGRDIYCPALHQHQTRSGMNSERYLTAQPKLASIYFILFSGILRAGASIFEQRI